MDEVENPALPAAGETSPTIRPVDDGVETANGSEREDALAVKPGIDTAEAEGLVVEGEAGEQLPATRAIPPARPPLTRDSSQPPPSQPPPAPPAQPAQPAETGGFPQDPPDSLTLADLKRIRNSFPNAQIAPKQQLLEHEKVYDFDYQDAQSFPVEIEEWFSYSEEQDNRLRRCKAVFNDEWRATEHGKLDWLDVTEDARRSFIQRWVDVLQHKPKEQDVSKALMVLTYICLGVWEETAGRQEGCALEDLFNDSKLGGSRLDEYRSSSLQVQWVVAMVDALHACCGLHVIYDTLRHACENDFKNAAPDMSSRNEPQIRRTDESLELWCSLTLLYLFVEIARTTTHELLREELLELEPNLLKYLTQVVARLRWDEHAPVPLTKMLLLAWKTILVSFGGIRDVERVKASLTETRDEKDTRGQPLITASPLDYHLFRQEISSKYPAYQPPPPLFALEPENNSILPPLKHRRPSYAAMNEAMFTGAPTVGTGSIMHQPVHIATPAPSPPPSPAGPGKAGKKQNYQTNQMFPFLYPPLDASSNELGGKGSTELQDALVGRRWEGSDVPTSILEAAGLFAQRMRATRAMKQLWEARVDFMTQERGWKNPEDDCELPEVDDFELVPTLAPEETAEQGQPVAKTDEQIRLARVNDYYHDSLPHLQSVVIVLLKAVLQNVTDLVTKGHGQNGLQAGIQFNDTNGVNGAKPLENGVNGHSDGVESTAEELDKLRSQEITAKALSGILLLLLKWFKVSHILQYEYMTQLLLDSNYVPLILKLWQTQEIGRACHYKLDRDERNFFYFCQTNSRHGVPKLPEAHTNDAAAEESEDDAAPPPIKLKRDEPQENPQSPVADMLDFTHPPEVDELGYPQTPLPPTPLKSCSYRNIFSAINYLRVLQKITRGKTHRALLLVSYKSSNHLKKTLKIPVHPLRYYTLKLFKSQVPFCGRKWRQGNMKIITAVWLSVPAELRDDWLSGGGGGMGGACVGDVDGTVEDALPLEQSLRALTHWWNVRNFPDVMGVERGMLEEEMDFFARELEKMEGMGREEDVMGAEEQGLGGEAWQGPIEGY